MAYENFFLSLLIADRINGRKYAPGKLAIRNRARIRIATVKLSEWLNPPRRESKKVRESSCTPYPLTDIGTNVTK
jgi:hypothetical protein